jgi:hypothetical protein
VQKTGLLRKETEAGLARSQGASAFRRKAEVRPSRFLASACCRIRRVFSGNAAAGIQPVPRTFTGAAVEQRNRLRTKETSTDSRILNQPERWMSMMFFSCHIDFFTHAAAVQSDRLRRAPAWPGIDSSSSRAKP